MYMVKKLKQKHSETPEEIKQFVRGLSLGVVLTILLIFIFNMLIVEAVPNKVVSPLGEEPVPSSSPEPARSFRTVKNSKNTTLLRGEASYYSVEGCIGCNDERIMANGEVLEDSNKTVALTPEIVRKHKLMNKTVKIINTTNDMTVYAKVTDTGGFGELGRVADLSVATKNAIDCNDLCNVIVYY